MGNRVHALFVVLLLCACATTQQPMSNAQIDEFLEQFKQKSERVIEQQKLARQHGIDELRIENPEAPLPQQLVTASLNRADLKAVIERLGVEYVLSGVSRLSGRVTASLNRLAMPDALRSILAPVQLQASVGDRVVTISPLPQVALALAGEDDYVMRKRVLIYADTRALEPILDSLLYEPDSDSNSDDDDDDSSSSDGASAPSKGLSYAVLNAENAILVKGPSAKVKNALAVLDAVDSDTGHIMIEATVMTFSTTHLLQIGSRINDAAKGNLSDVSIDWESLTGETISFTSVAGAANTRAFQAAISLLLQDDEARVLARPYLAAIPGYQATIEVAEDRYVTTFTQNTGDVTLEPVTSGITLNMTPFLLPEDQIRMDIDVTVSQFIPTLSNVALARSRSSAASTMRIPSGQTFVIGGMMAEQSSGSHAGIPGARSIPLLGWLFGEKKKTSGERRVLIYITPYVWEPKMESPTGIEAGTKDFMKLQDQLERR